MKKFTKWISLMTAALLAATTLTACGSAPADNKQADTAEGEALT